MSEFAAPRLEPVPGGGVDKAPFVRLPDPGILFARRAERFRSLAPGHPLEPYLAFLGGLTAAQGEVAGRLPDGALPSAADRARSAEYGMPMLNRNAFPSDPTFAAALDGLVDGAADVPMPDAAREALAVVRHADDEGRARMAQAVLDNAVPFETVAEHVYVAAALQVHAARLAARLDPAPVLPLSECVCPACGSAPTSSAIVGWPGAETARYCACSLCGTLWNYVRVRCTACGSTEGISYQEVENGAGTVKAECCTGCRSSLKILHQHREVVLDPVADDVASLALDLLVAEDGFRRSGVNPFLFGY